MADESAEITLNTNADSTNRMELVQPFRAENVGSQTVDVKPLSQTQTLDVKPMAQTLELKPLSQTSSETIEVRPVRVDSRQEMAVTDPIRTDASSTVDLRPVVVELCTRVGEASPPPRHVCEPYRHRVGLTVMGIELLGLDWSGETQTIVTDRPPTAPMLAWGEVSRPPPREEGLPGHRPAGPWGGGVHHPAAGGAPGGSGGLRIRLTG